MSFRRFVYLVTDDRRRRIFPLRRIDMSRFFFPKHKRDDLLANPPPLEEGRLPSVAMTFVPPIPKFGKGRLHFMLLAGAGDGVGGRIIDDKVVAADQEGRTLLYDSEYHSVGTLCNLAAPKSSPISLTVGRGLYILDTAFNASRDLCFERIVHDDPDSISDDDEWFRCVTSKREDLNRESLPPPPYLHDRDTHPGYVSSYTVAGGDGATIWVSVPNLGTYSFDTGRRACTWAKAGDWALPFYGHAHHVLEHGLWFGLSSGYSDGYGDDAYVCASDLIVAPPTARVVWGRPAPPECSSKWYYLVHLGGSRFCHARFYEIVRPYLDRLKFVELTGLEAARCEAAGGELVVVQHRSVRYSIDNLQKQWFL